MVLNTGNWQKQPSSSCPQETALFHLEGWQKTAPEAACFQDDAYSTLTLLKALRKIIADRFQHKLNRKLESLLGAKIAYSPEELKDLADVDRRNQRDTWE